MRNIVTIAKRELGGYFSTPVAYVFIVVYLLLAMGLTLFITRFYEREQADLLAFFTWHPWVYLFLVPAVTMRLWAEERRQGTIELLFTLPVTLAESVVGKFLASWAFTGIALALTFPIWITVNYLGKPDNGVILSSYVGSFLMAGAYLAIGSFVSACTKNQVIAFVVSAVLCLIFVLAGLPGVMDVLSALPDVVLQTMRSFSFLTHFESIQTGVIDLRDITYFLSLIATCLVVNAIVLDMKKAS
ncbi:MAG: ABC transporter permease subunit [Planctomycetes bacterium]|nr:ABC transporter permease subunit [Planctomycetota bacterium]